MELYEFLTNIIKINKNIKELKFHCHFLAFNKRTITVILEALKENQSNESLVLSTIDFGNFKYSMQNLLDLFTSNKTIKYLNLSKNIFWVREL